MEERHFSLIFIFLLYWSPKSDIRVVANSKYSSSGDSLERATVPFPRLLSPQLSIIRIGSSASGESGLTEPLLMALWQVSSVLVVRGRSVVPLPSVVGTPIRGAVPSMVRATRGLFTRACLISRDALAAVFFKYFVCPLHSRHQRCIASRVFRGRSPTPNPTLGGRELCTRTAAILEIFGHGLILERLARRTRTVSCMERVGKHFVSPVTTNHLVGLPPLPALSVQNLTRTWRGIGS